MSTKSALWIAPDPSCTQRDGLNCLCKPSSLAETLVVEIGNDWSCTVGYEYSSGQKGRHRMIVNPRPKPADAWTEEEWAARTNFLVAHELGK